MRDLVKEIRSTLSNNRLRTALTGFAVSWGIFLLIALLGAGNGLMNAFMGSNDRFVKNAAQVWGGTTSLPYAGFKEGRWVRLNEQDAAITAGPEFKDEVEEISPLTRGQDVVTTWGENSVSANLTGVYPNLEAIDKILLQHGRFINPNDLAEKRKVAVIGTGHARLLTAGTSKSPESLVGSHIRAGEFSFLVIGIYQTDETDMSRTVYTPYTTQKALYNTGERISSLKFTTRGLNSIPENEAFEQRYRRRLNQNHDAAPDDPNAVWIWNRNTQSLRMGKAEGIIRTFLWILGLLTLVSGIVGVSNIMLISVKERTHEFGIRKAIGAKPRDVLTLILAESVTITAAFGYVGMLLGMAACEVMNRTVGQRTVDLGFQQIHILEDPTVGLGVALEATLVLIVAGTLAGLAPARKAAHVRPIEALRAE